MILWFLAEFLDLLAGTLTVLAHLHTHRAEQSISCRMVSLEVRFGFFESDGKGYTLNVAVMPTDRAQDKGRMSCDNGCSQHWDPGVN